jgi:hypothetical protein
VVLKQFAAISSTDGNDAVAEAKKCLRRIGNAALKRFGAVFEEDEVKP